MAVAILDIDGTLVDTNYHHAISWYRAFREHEIVLPVWQIHRHIGMGGDQVVQALTDERTECDRGDEIRATEAKLYGQLIDEVETMEGSRELIEQLHDRGHTVVLASSAKEAEVDHYLDLLDARELVEGWTTAADVQATKPEPDLVQAALARAGTAEGGGQDAGGSEDAGDGERGVMIGDTPWDVRAARKAHVSTLAVLTGGFSVEELREAGAVAVFESVAELCSKLDQTALR